MILQPELNDMFKTNAVAQKIVTIFESIYLYNSKCQQQHFDYHF